MCFFSTGSEERREMIKGKEKGKRIGGGGFFLAFSLNSYCSRDKFKEISSDRRINKPELILLFHLIFLIYS